MSGLCLKKALLVLSTLGLCAACSGGSNDPAGPGDNDGGPGGGDPPGAGGGDAGASTLPAFVERLPGSPNHSPDGTWWGYNMSKVVRRGSFVFTYVIENDDNPSTYSTFRIYKKDGDGDWTAGAEFDTTRPGNILIDSNGGLHAFVFEATDIGENDSVGKLLHYTMAGAAEGDITSFTRETVVDHVSGDETVNIRVGAAIGTDDRMVVAFGLRTDADGDTEQVLTKVVGGAWTQESAGTQLGHDFYYPFVALTSTGAICLLPIQDDFTGTGNPNIYQIIRFFKNSGTGWSAENIVDHTSHTLAAGRARLLEQSDLYVDASDGVHIFYKEYLSADEGRLSSIKHLTGSMGSWTTQTIDPALLDLNWVKMIEVDGTRYLVGTSNEQLYIMDETGTTIQEIPVPGDMSGIYPYVATRQGGTSDSEEYLDIVLLNGRSGDYPNAANYYVRIDKSEITF